MRFLLFALLAVVSAQDDGEDTFLCIRRCLRDVRLGLEDTVDVQELNNGFMGSAVHSRESFDHICLIYSNFKHCLDSCGDFSEKTSILMTMKSLEYICVEKYDDFMSLMPCFAKTNDQIMSECSSCGGNSYIADQMELLEIAGNRRDVLEMLDILGNICGFSLCQLDCQGRVYRAECDTNLPTELMREMMHSAVNQSREVMISGDLEAYFPETCRALYTETHTDYTTPTTAMPPTTTTEERIEAKVETSTPPKHECPKIESEYNPLDVLQLEEMKLKLEIRVLKLQERKLEIELKKLENEQKQQEEKEKNRDRLMQIFTSPRSLFQSNKSIFDSNKSIFDSARSIFDRE